MALSLRKHQLILEAAVAAFLDNGYSSTSMDEVARRAGVSKRTVYRHFASKADLFEAIAHQAFAQFKAAYETGFEPGRPIQEQLGAIARTEGALFTSERFMRLGAVLWAETYRDPDLAARVPRFQDDSDALAGFMADAMAAGVLRKADPRRASSHFKALLKAEGFWPHLVRGEVVPTDKMAVIEAEAVALFLSHYGPEG
ncbi:TetR/AcrR family transcriptional regulator [Phenylobacterium conjunctum]|uniref:TetR/AcrR family transcriptional regulator n=1 Tax=Phenylobacterium conjunctum TaxID=1298959 RepID=A0ABW3SWS1_9CAUL